MNYEDFIRPAEQEEEVLEATEKNEENAEIEPSVELDVQKAVVESLAADKAEQDVEIERLRKENAALAAEKRALAAERASLRASLSEMESDVAKLKEEIVKVGDFLAKNSELPKPNQVTLLERNTDLEDRFEGETRDHVLEALKEARDRSEAEGRARRAQLLESVLVANEPYGTLERRRQALGKLFTDNQNVINGQVINELDKMNITYKVGENYLLVGEIMKRTY